VTWGPAWPIKPDFVLEGGNAILSPSGDVDTPDALSLLTTYRYPLLKPLVTTGDTSAAAALAGRMAATLAARQPDLWPETLRCLLIHSARWTRAMWDTLPNRLTPKQRKNTLLRRYGWGVPDLERASASAINELTLIAQRTLHPFKNTSLPRRAPNIQTRDWHLHHLPWPVEVLEDLGGMDVTLRVTLSYFIEPNPARRGWVRRHRYQSCGLRFALRNAEESLADFRARVSKDDQAEGAGRPSFAEPGWTLGARLRDRGSVHSDIWTGPAADLAARGLLAVYPVGGWWRERPRLQRWDKAIRYALTISIFTPDTEIDLYTPVAVQVGIPVEIET